MPWTSYRVGQYEMSGQIHTAIAEAARQANQSTAMWMQLHFLEFFGIKDQNEEWLQQRRSDSTR